MDKVGLFTLCGLCVLAVYGFNYLSEFHSTYLSDVGPVKILLVLFFVHLMIKTFQMFLGAFFLMIGLSQKLKKWTDS